MLKLKVSSFEISTMMHSIPITAFFKITLIISLLLFQFLTCYQKWGGGWTPLILHWLSWGWPLPNATCLVVMSYSAKQVGDYAPTFSSPSPPGSDAHDMYYHKNVHIWLLLQILIYNLQNGLVLICWRRASRRSCFWTNNAK